MRGSAAFRTGVAPGGALAGPWVKNELYRKARAVPSLDLRFADNKLLTDAITGANLVTFNRASTGTYVGSDGVLRSAVTNLRTFSNAILSANFYGLANSALTTVSITNPFNGTTASLFTLNIGANTGNNTDGFNFGSGTTLVNSTTHAQSLFVKPTGTTVLRLRSNVTGALFDFTLTGNGTAPSPSSDLQSASIVSFANGWYRVSWTFTSTTSAPGNRGDYWTIKTDIADGTNGLYVVGAQIEQASTVGEYIPTTSAINSAPRFDHNPTTGESLGLLVEEDRTNVLTWSEDFSNAAWTSVAATLLSNTATAPNGALTADSYTATAVSGEHRILRASNVTVTASSTITFSVFVKASGITRLRLNIYDSPSRIKEIVANVNLSTETIALPTAGGGYTAVASSIQPYPNSFYRISITGTVDAATTSVLCDLGLQSSAGNGTWTPVGTEALIVWGAQLEAGAFPTSYIKNIDTALGVTRAADVASITGTNFGTTRTNLLLRSEEFDNASWGNSQSTDLANTAVAPNGTTTADSLIEDSSAGVQHFTQKLVTVAANTLHTVSVFVKANTRSAIRFGLLNNTLANGAFAHFNAATGVISTQTTAGTATSVSYSIEPYTNGWYRCRVSCVIDALSTTASVFIGLVNGSDNATYTGDGTSGIYLWGAQLETGSTATAYIPTTTAVVSVFESSFYNQTEGTVFAEGGPTNPTLNKTQLLLTINDGSANNRMYLGKKFDSTTVAEFGVASGGVGQAFILTTPSSISNARFAAGYKVNDFAVASSGGALATDTSGSVPVSSTQLLIGTLDTGSNNINGTIRRLTYWPTRLANSTLQAITQ